jgi:ketol-acid reductoisomerase
MHIYYDRDADVKLITTKKVAIVGFGNQGRPHALNLRDSGVREIVIGELKDSAPWKQAEKDNFKVMNAADASNWADVVMILTPDEYQPKMFISEIRDSMRKGTALGFAHGLSIHFHLIEPDPQIDVFMAGPRAPGPTVRYEYERGGGVPCVVAVAQDASGQAMALALSYACAIGSGRAGMIETTFKNEVETDLFGEQCVINGGLSDLIMAGFDTLVEAGYPSEMAYFECLHEMKLCIDLIQEGGIANLRRCTSNTAEYGAYLRGPRIINQDVRKHMKEILEEIRSGQFVKEWMVECQVGMPQFKALRRKNAEHLIDQVGKDLREMMPWLTKDKNV